jgi:hypothetical protein
MKTAVKVDRLKLSIERTKSLLENLIDYYEVFYSSAYSGVRKGEHVAVKSSSPSDLSSHVAGGITGAMMEKLTIASREIYAAETNVRKAFVQLAKIEKMIDSLASGIEVENERMLQRTVSEIEVAKAKKIQSKVKERLAGSNAKLPWREGE